MTGEFSSEMESISKVAINFFNKYKTDSKSLEFAADLGKLIAPLRSRAQKEENILYKAFDEI